MSKSFIITTLILFAVDFYKCICQVQIVAENNLVDLFTGIQLTFSQLAALWTLNGVKPAQTLICSTANIISGPQLLKCGDFIQRVYEPLSSHSIIYYGIVIYLIDSWQPGNIIKIEFDNKEALSFEPSQILTTTPTNTNLCGAAQKDEVITIVGSVFHSSKTLTFTISSYPSNSQAFYGFREIQMIFKDKKGYDIDHSCISTTLNVPKACTCVKGKYFDYGTFTCKTCHPSCSSCSGPTENNCNICPYYKGYSKTSDTCVACPGNCFFCSESKCYVCSTPYLSNWKYDCINSNLCQPPYIKDSGICKTPCEASNNYLLWNNSCSDSCDFPFIARIEEKAKFCDLPCTSNPISFSYWNGSCQTACPFFQRDEGGKKFCDACQHGYFMFPNNTCLSDCPNPYKQRIEGWSKFCDYPCSKEAIFYYPKEPKCRSICEYPNQIRDDVFCVLDIPAEEQAQVQAMVGTISSTGTITKSAGSSVSLITFSNPAAIFMQAFMDMFGYVKYLKIKYPPKLQYSFTVKVDPPFKFLPDCPEEILAQIPKYPLPEKFQENEDLHSSFLVNFWPPLLILSLLSLAIIAFWCLEKCTKRVRFVRPFVSKLNSILRWNFSLTLFSSYFGQVVFFTSFEFRTANPDTALQIISFVICFFINLFVLVAIVKMVSIIFLRWEVLSQMKQNKISLEIMRKIDSKISSFEVLYQDLRDGSIFQLLFPCFFVLRVYMYVAIIAYLFDSPFVQMIMIVFMNATMLCYLLIFRPQKSKLELIHYILQEIVMLIANTSVFILSLFDWMNKDNISFRETLGEIIINSNIAFSGVAAAYLVIQVFLLLRAGIKFLLILYKRYYKLRPIHQFTADSSQSNLTITSETSNINSYNLQHQRRSFIDNPIITRFQLSRPQEKSIRHQIHSIDETKRNNEESGQIPGI